jgi:SAM-dependent methyltransferase
VNTRDHWESVYATKHSDEVSWFQREPAVSLDLITRWAPDPAARIIDVGCGASMLVDRLLAAGYANVTLLDVSATALAETRRRLGDAAPRVEWIEGDVLTAPLHADAFDVWHDRAVFHFLIGAAERAAYVARVRRSLRAGGHVVIGTFAEDGPLKCSGLPVMRYSAEGLAAEFAGFTLVESARDLHVTPSGGRQPFQFCVFRGPAHGMQK